MGEIKKKSILDHIYKKVEFVDYTHSKFTKKKNICYYDGDRITTLAVFLEKTINQLKSNITSHKCKLIVDCYDENNNFIESKRLYFLLPQNIIFDIISSLE